MRWLRPLARARCAPSDGRRAPQPIPSRSATSTCASRDPALAPRRHAGPPCLRSGTRSPDRCARTAPRGGRGPGTDARDRSDAGGALPSRRGRPDPPAVLDAVGSCCPTDNRSASRFTCALSRAPGVVRLSAQPVSLRSEPPDLRERLRRSGAPVARRCWTRSAARWSISPARGTASWRSDSGSPAPGIHHILIGPDHLLFLRRPAAARRLGAAAADRRHARSRSPTA